MVQENKEKEEERMSESGITSILLGYRTSAKLPSQSRLGRGLSLYAMQDDTTACLAPEMVCFERDTAIGSSEGWKA
jgi:hypothetical protein